MASAVKSMLSGGEEKGEEKKGAKYGAVAAKEDKNWYKASVQGADSLLGGENSKERELVMNPTAREKEHKKMMKLLDGATDKAPPAIVKYLKMIEPCVAGGIVCCEACVPIYARIFRMVAFFVAALPVEELGILLGLLLCFFGGMFPMVMAAAEAWRQCGGAQTNECVHDLYAQFCNAKAASDEDDKKDDDGDGIPDVEQISGTELAKRKSHIVLSATDPVLLDKSFKGVYSACAAVIAVLKLAFARTIALGAAIGDFLTKWAMLPGTHLLVNLLEPDIHKWIPNFISYTCKIIGIIVAWNIQVVITAFYSAVRGGLLVSRNVLRKLAMHNIVKIDPDETSLDEVAGWALAALGFWLQLKSGFSAPLWITILLWPLATLETALVGIVYSP